MERSKHVECSVCLEEVLSKAIKTEARWVVHDRDVQKFLFLPTSKSVSGLALFLAHHSFSFGILPNCSHPFCISCIRDWRSRTDEQGQATRSCPLCRTKSWFVIPSNIWVDDPEEKQELIDAFKYVLRAWLLFNIQCHQPGTKILNHLTTLPVTIS